MKLKYLCILCTHTLLAQKTTVEGVIFNSDSIPLARATITIYPSEKSYLTNDKGEFVINNHQNEKVLMVSHISSIPRRVNLEKDKQKYLIYLEKQINQLEEVDLNKQSLSGSLTYDTQKTETRQDTLQLGELQQHVNKPKPIPELKTYGWEFDGKITPLGGSLGPIYRLIFRKKHKKYKRWDTLDKIGKIKNKLDQRNDISFILDHFRLKDSDYLAIAMFECELSIQDAQLLFREELIKKVSGCIKKNEK